jgi:hypothetical protein
MFNIQCDVSGWVDGGRKEKTKQAVQVLGLV